MLTIAMFSDATQKNMAQHQADSDVTHKCAHVTTLKIMTKEISQDIKIL